MLAVNREMSPEAVIGGPMTSDRRPTLPGETVIRDWGSVVLTDRRVWFWSADGGVSLSIDEVEWVALRRESQIGWLVLLVLALLALAGFAIMQREFGVPEFVSLLAAGLFFACFAFSRKVTAVIGAGQGVVRQAVPGGKAATDAATAFLNQVEQVAIAARSTKRANREAA